MKPDSHDYYEAMDRAYMQTEMLERALEDSPVLDRHEKARDLYEKAQEALFDLYQYLGEIQPED